MESWLFGIVGCLTIALFALLFKIHGIHKAADEIMTLFAEKLASETNTLIDISCGDKKMRKLAAQLNRQLRLLRGERARYAQGDNELKEAITNISHDLRTPLTAMYGYFSLLNKEEMSGDAARYVSLIENRAEALRRLTEELFRYSVIATSEKQKPEQIDLTAELEESLVSFYGVMTEKGIGPLVTLPQTRVERRLDRISLARVLANLIGNALKYSDGDLSVSLDESGTIVISNTARGLTKVTAAKLFDRFYTVETGRNSTGLGLSIAKLLTERMGGEIRADYQEQQLVVTLKFPPNIPSAL